ncbi:uncharacterized protein (TIGR01244 family) [Nitrospirillum amazonense]|uniref:Uncharacterized protein (TIGR01244 family) n=1 Tax=Nitrospirillum amazonense TaxID=28077 RepID=A0A560FGT2_9PROT|nr:TIGR01244 family sulfur transferase [Nitrospirillum amazonense]TWB20823.1 uncharacterized protein (TIGR01244 family) [Nitrospirillum amazonense]
MLTPRPLTDNLSVAPQIKEADFAQAKALGFRTIINNRPDGEEPGQLTSARGAELAKEAGLDYVYLPVNQSNLGPQTAAAFAEALAKLPGPVLAHCRSGTRSTILWSLGAAANGTPVTEIIEAAGRQGYDLSPYAGALESLARG